MVTTKQFNEQFERLRKRFLGIDDSQPLREYIELDRNLTDEEEAELEAEVIKHFDRYARREALLKKQRQLHEQLLDKQCSEGAAPKYIQELHDSLAKNEMFDSKDYLITVNPKPDTPVESIIKKTEKYLGRKCHDGGVAVLEQRSQVLEDAGEGAHVHIVVQATQTDANFRKNTRNSFKSLVGVPSRHIHIRRIRQGELPEVLSYVNGDKNEEEKKKKVEIDRPWRENLGVPDLIISPGGHPYLLHPGKIVGQLAHESYGDIQN